MEICRFRYFSFFPFSYNDSIILCTKEVRTYSHMISCQFSYVVVTVLSHSFVASELFSTTLSIASGPGEDASFGVFQVRHNRQFCIVSLIVWLFLDPVQSAHPGL